MRKIKSIVVCFLMIMTAMSSVGLDQPFPVYGYIKDSKGNAVSGAQVIIKDLTRLTQIVVYTNEQGYYQADLSNLPECQSGDTIEVYCYYNNEDNNRTFVLDLSLTSKNVSFNLVGVPYAKTLSAENITSSSAKINGELIHLNDTSCQVWFEYGETISYGNSTTKNTYYGPANFSATLSGLKPDTTYHFRVVAKNSRKTFYGNDVTFKTSPSPPEVATNDASDVSYNQANLNGYLSKVGASSCEVWFVYDDAPHDKIEDYRYNTSHIVKTSPSSFSSKISGLEVNKTYYFRAVAKNLQGIAYGEEKNFTTKVILPSVSTLSAENITSNSAYLKGKLDDRGGDEYCQVWFEYGETTSYGFATGILTINKNEEFSIKIENLTSGKTYHFRAVAKNSKGISYGMDKTFKTNSTKASIETSFANYAIILRANLVDTGGEACYVCFEYWKEGNETIYRTDEKMMSLPGIFEETISGLEENTRYYYRAVVRNSQGISYGTNLSFLTSSAPLAPVLGESSAIPSFNSVKLECNVSLGSNEFCYLWFEVGNGKNITSEVMLVEEDGVVNCTVEGLESGRNYSYRAIAVGSDGGIAYGERKNFSTPEKENHEPSITIIYPENGSVVDVRTSLMAEIYDEDNDVMSVKFYLNGNVFVISSRNGVVSINLTLEHGKNYSWYAEVSDGKANISSEIYYFSTKSAIEANFTNSFVFEKEIAYFNDSSSGEIISWLWDFGDGSFSYEKNASHVYDKAGSYIVTLTVTDIYGESASKEKIINVFSRGDANMDGKINALDITKIRRIIALLDEKTPPADLNLDGTVDLEDLQLLINKILGK
ncbi:MAG: PKD domain-containing protein [Thermoplasmatales archaeon]|nr:PKD domain-containing protein [Thermoplasmatales archaeon]